MAERILTINIRKYLATQPRTKRTKKAIRYIRERVAHYTKTELDSVKLSQDLNVQVFKVYAKTMVPLKVSVKIEKGIATVAPFGVKESAPSQIKPANSAQQAKPDSQSKKPDAKKQEKQETKLPEKKGMPQSQSKAQPGSEPAPKPKNERQQQQEQQKK